MIERNRRSRRLSDEEAELWRGVARSVKPLRPAAARRSAGDGAADGAVAAQNTKTGAAGAPPSKTPRPKAADRATAAVTVRPTPKPATPPAPSLATLDRRTKQKLARGREAIDARIDLHGMTQAEAFGALSRFLMRVQADGARFVIVVTGKGGRGDGERGVLRRQVPQWLRLPEFRHCVVGFETAHIGHGGEGALYVRVRRGR